MSSNSNYSLDVLQLWSRQGGFTDLIPYMGAMEIFEDIHSPFLQAQIDLLEAQSIIETLPIVGDEWVFCSLRVHGIHNGASRYINFFLDVYKIEDEQTYKHKGTMFRLRLISQLFKKNANKRCRKFFVGTQDAIVAEIADAQLGKGLERVDACEFEEEYIFPNWHPVGCIKKLAKNSSSIEYKDPDYMFYEDLDGLHYVSASYMMDEKNGKVEPSGGGNFVSKIVDEFIKTETDFNISEYHKKHSFDIVDNVNKGMYGTTLIHHDIANRRWREDGSNYMSTYEDFKHLGFLPLTLLVTSKHEKNRMQLIPMNGIENPGVYQDEFYRDQKKKIVIRQMQSEQNLMVLEIDGEPNMKIGYPMTFELMSIKDDDKETQHDKLYGDFLITKIRHVFMREEYRQFVEISKDSYDF